MEAPTYAVLVLHQALVVSGNGHKEEKAVNILETVDPLLSLGSLATDVEHAICQLAEVEYGLCDTRGS